MYTDTVQTFVILGGAFILMGYGMLIGRGMWRSQGYRSGSWDMECLRRVGCREGVSTGVRSPDGLPTQVSTKWAGIQGFSTNTWGQ